MALEIQRQKMPTPLEAFDEMFGSTPIPSGGITKISTDKLIPYVNQPFSSYDYEKIQELAADISQNGILSPVIVRKHPTQDGAYEILAGHNRTKAAKRAGIKDIPCIIKDVDDTVAALIMVNTNLNQRQELLPSEKALAYKIQHECMASLSKSQNGIVSAIATKGSESIRSVQRYIRLASLRRSLLLLVDSAQIAVLAGVELTYLSETNQERLATYLSRRKAQKIDLKQAIALRELENNHPLYDEYIEQTLSPIAKAPTHYKLNKSKLDVFIPTGCEDTEGYILEALAFYNSREK